MKASERGEERNRSVVDLETASQLAHAERYADALLLVQRCLERDPDSTPAWQMGAQLLLRLGRLDEAVRAAQSAVRSAPRDAPARYLLGRTLKAQGKLAGAIEQYKLAATLDPLDPDVLTSLGIASRALGETEQAVAYYRHSLALRPEQPEVHRNLANALAALKRYQEAGTHWRKGGLERAARAAPLLQRALEHMVTSRYKEAVAAFNEALQLLPDVAGLWLNAGEAYARAGAPEEALRCYERAAELDPSSVEAADACRGLAVGFGLVDRVERYSRVSLAMRASDDGLLVQRLCLPAIQASHEAIRRSRERYANAIDELLRRPMRMPKVDEATGSFAFYLAYHGLVDKELQVNAARLHLHAYPDLEWCAPHCIDPQPPTGRIRVGLISHFLYDHSIGTTTRGFVEKLSRDKFELFVLRVPPLVSDDVAAHIENAADHVVRLPASIVAAREKIAELRLDILFYQDVGMERISYFLAFARLAPVQCVSFGHPNTTGIPTMDWFVSNDRFETPAAAGHYSERLFLLHGLPTLAYYHAPSRTGEPVSRSDYGFDADETLYLCPQTSFKVHPDMDALIAGVLRGDPRGCVVLIDFFRPWSDELRQRFERSLCDVAGRIRFVSKMRANDYLGLLEMSDVVLDTVHFNGMNSSLEAFAMGTPVVTWPQETQRSRHTFGMYMSMGMIDCVARDALDYVAIALRLGTDRAHAEMVRKRIAERRHVLFEDSRVIAEFERFFVAAIAERFGSVTPLGSGA